MAEAIKVARELTAAIWALAAEIRELRNAR